MERAWIQVIIRGENSGWSGCRSLSHLRYCLMSSERRISNKRSLHWLHCSILSIFNAVWKLYSNFQSSVRRAGS